VGLGEPLINLQRLPVENVGFLVFFPHVVLIADRDEALFLLIRVAAAGDEPERQKRDTD
jgi:hypothetical protein